MSPTCEACQSSRVEEANLTSMAVQPKRAGTLAKLQAGAAVSALVCLDCGRLGHLRADVARLRAMLGE